MSANPRDVNVRVGMDPSKYEKGSQQVTWQTKQMLRQQEIAERKWRALQKAHAEALAENERKERQVYLAHTAALRENQAREEAAARASAEAHEKAQREIQEQIERTHKVMTMTGTVMLASGGAIAAGLAISAKAAVSWESAWTGVLKTVDATPAQLAQVEGGLRGLARTLPATHGEIAGVAEAAGQLGVSAGQVTSFTKTMVDLGETTDLTAEEAATSIAQMATVIDPAMLKSGDGVQRFGATLVALGNDGASTESQILRTAQRISGSAALIGASSADTLALASSLASMGIEAELGGGVASRVLTKLYSVVQSGGAELQEFASVAGMSAADFAAAFGRDPIAALGLVTNGLNRVEASGGNVISTLSDLGFKSTEDVRVLLQLKGAGDLLTNSLELANTAWDENTALLDEANKRYDTTEAKLQIAKNTIIDAAIGIGETFLPVLSDTATSVSDLVAGFASMPAPVQTAVGVLGGLAATVGIVGGGFLLAYPRAVEMVNSLRDLGVISDTTTGKLKKVGPALQGISKGAGALAAAAAAVQILDSIAASAEPAALGVEQTLSALLSLNGTDVNAAFSGISSSVTDLDSALDLLLGGGFDSWIERTADAALGWTGVSSQVAQTADQFKTVGLALAQLVDSGRSAEAAQIFDDIAAAAEEQGYSVEQLKELMPAYAEALAQVENEQAGAAEEFTNTTTTVQEQTAALEENFKAMLDASGQALSLRDAQRGMEAAYDDARKALEENGATLDVTTAKGRANQAALDGIASAGLDVIESMQANGASQKELRGVMETTRDRFIKTAQAMGASKTEARELADQLGLIPKNIRTSVAVTGTTDALARLSSIDSTLNRIDGKVVTAGVAIKQYGQAALATGGPMLTGFPTGGRLPGTPPANTMQDNLVGVDGSGMPRVLVRSREWVVNEGAADYYGDGLMSAINARAIPREVLQGLAGLAAGGEVGAATRQVSSAARELERARAQMKRARQAAASAAAMERRAQRTETERDDRVAARAERDAERLVNAAEKRLDKAEKALQDARARRERLNSERVDVATQLRRGEIRSSVTGGLSGALSITDQLRDLAGSGDVGAWRRERLRAVAGNAEKALTSLYKQAEKIDLKAARAVERYEKLKAVQESVQNTVTSGFSLAGVEGAVDPWSGAQGTPTAKALAASAKSYASKARRFADLIEQLRKKGASAAVLQEVAAYGVEQGVPIAEALLADLPALQSLNTSYADIEKFGGWAGASVARSVGGGQGLYEAQQAVEAAEAQAKAIDKRIENWSKVLGRELAKALGIKARAVGGPTAAGRAYLVGEEGPELHMPRDNGYMLTARQTKYAMTQPTRTVVVNVTNVHPLAEPSSVTTNKALNHAAALGV
ncbi:phage tail tape measure protein [Promicromonospora thailandica]|uniref:Phage tail tape measure protein, TP901 family, core region n=1 Tax=Promicromonospora thailandica TaxID=765201 RepID=A0A9X2JVY5_9MICO|nr:phage tail tape measure protein [Promicromonospora thailandica]MCP2265576.1 phage tail tape measure protein, TP901 family, core region [Promicromonospora thailandica]